MKTQPPWGRGGGNWVYCYLSTVGERRAAGHVDGDRAQAVAEERVDAAAVEQKLESVERSPVVRSDAPATTTGVRYHCDQHCPVISVNSKCDSG